MVLGLLVSNVVSTILVFFFFVLYNASMVMSLFVGFASVIEIVCDSIYYSLKKK